MLSRPVRALLGLVLVCLCTGVAQAHPLGNFTINHLAIVTPGRGVLHVRYVLDIAEIPSFQIMHAADAWNDASMRAWAENESQVVLDGFSIESDGRAVVLHLDRVSARTRPGAGGLPTLYWTGDYTATVPSTASIVMADRVYADRRIGWKDIALPGSVDPTDSLQRYPSDVIGSPRRNDRASFVLQPSGTIAHAAIGAGDDAAPVAAPSLVRSSALSDLFSRRDQTPLLILLTVLAAFGLGALHALEPGHGKALLAFTLVGSRATFKQAAILAGALTFAHTIAVLLLGLVLFFAAGFATETLFAWITLVSGAAVAFIGARSLASAVRRTVPHGHGAHAHAHDHGHSHAVPGKSPLQFRSAAIAAMSGGIAPCPAAIVVLLTALHLHRVGYGIFLIVVFSLGLAAVLTGVGIAVVRGASWLQGRGAFDRVARFAPLLSSGVISIIGAAMLAQGFADQGIRVAPAAVIALTLAAIAGFAFVPHHHHHDHHHERLETA